MPLFKIFLFFLFFLYLCIVRIIKPVPRVLTKEYRAATWCSFFIFLLFFLFISNFQLIFVKNYVIMGDRYDIGVDVGEGKDYTSQVFLHGKEVKWDKPIEPLCIKLTMEEEMKRYARLCDILLCDCEKRIDINRKLI